MAKVPTLTDISNVLTSTTSINANWDAIQEAFRNTLSLDGSTPNAMEADLDMNSNDIINIKTISVDSLYLDGQYATLATLVNDSEKVNYETRPDLVTAVSQGIEWADGTLLFDGTVFYKADSTSTIISDLPGLTPVDPSGYYDCLVEHFVATSKDAATEVRTFLQTAINYAQGDNLRAYGEGGKVGLMSRQYTISGSNSDGYCLIISDAVTIEGCSHLTTALYISTLTETMFYVGKGNTAIMADTTNTATVKGVAFKNLLFFNTISSTPTAGSFIRADRSAVEIDYCSMVNHYRGLELLGNPQNCRFHHSLIVQGSNAPARISFNTQTSPFTVGATLTWNGGDGTATIEAVDGGELTVRDITFASASSPLPVAGVTLVDDNGTPGSATASSGFVAKIGSCGIFIGRRQVNSALTIAVQDPTDGTYWTEPNTVHITDSNIEMGTHPDHYGGQYAILVDSCDTVSIQGCHVAFGAKACIGVIPSQSGIGLADIRVVGGLIDPLPGKSLYGVYIADDSGTFSTATGSISLSNVGVTGATKGAGIHCSLPIRRLNLDNVDVRQCGTYGLNINNSGVNRLTVNACHFDITNMLDNSYPAIRLNDGDRIKITNSSMDIGYRGIQLGTAVDRVVLTGNSFDALTSGTSIYLPAGWSNRLYCKDNDVDEDYVLTANNRLYIPVGLDYVHIEGATDIYEIRADAPVNSYYPGRRILASFDTAPDLIDDAASPGAPIAPNLRIGSDFTCATGTVVELLAAPDVEAAKWVIASTRANA